MIIQRIYCTCDSIYKTICSAELHPGSRRMRTSLYSVLSRNLRHCSVCALYVRKYLLGGDRICRHFADKMSELDTDEIEENHQVRRRRIRTRRSFVGFCFPDRNRSLNGVFSTDFVPSGDGKYGRRISKSVRPFQSCTGTRGENY